MARKKIPDDTQIEVLTRSRRRCCLCYFVDGVDGSVDGQIAHLDQNNEHADFDNLAFLCLRHHNIYDSRTSVSKGLQPAEVKHYRDRLYGEFENNYETVADGHNDTQSETRYGTGDFLEYLPGLTGNPLYILCKFVLIERSQVIKCAPNDHDVAFLVKAGFMEQIHVAQTLQEMRDNAPIPYALTPAAWRHLNDNKRWLLARAKERNEGLPDILRALELVYFDDTYV